MCKTTPMQHEFKMPSKNALYSAWEPNPYVLSIYVTKNELLLCAGVHTMDTFASCTEPIHVEQTYPRR